VFEWYDFYLYGSLSAVIAKHFFSASTKRPDSSSRCSPSQRILRATLRSVVFGRIGDLVGRKYTFLVTIVIMGSSTALVGMLPSYATIGVWAPIILSRCVFCRACAGWRIRRRSYLCC